MILSDLLAKKLDLLRLRSKLEDERFKLRCEQSLAFFYAKVVWPALEGDNKLEWSWPILLLAKNGECVMAGKPNRWIVNMSVRCGKSLILSVSLPIWYWLKDPSYRFAFHSHGPKLRHELQEKRRKVIRSAIFQKYWGDRVRLPIRTNIECVENDLGGQFQLLGPQATGLGADALIIDDPTSVRHARFESQMKIQEELVREAVFSRLNQTSGPIIVVQQRQSPEDLSGKLTAEQGWRATVVPPYFEEDTTIELFDGTVLQIPKGTLADPVRLSKENLDERRRTIGKRGFLASFMQKPLMGEEIVSAEWLKPYAYNRINWRSMMDLVVLSVDTASVGTAGHSRWGL